MRFIPPGCSQVCILTGFGWAGTYYLIDPTTGVTALLGTQVLHPHDAKVHGLWERLERAMYSAVTQELVK